jgi:hypothetical protein
MPGRYWIEPGRWSSDAVVTLTELRQIHTMAMSPVWGVSPHPDAYEYESPGSLRRHDIHPFPEGMVPPPWTEVPAALTQWIDDANRLQPRADLFPERAADLHCRFEQIHPFLDGNGRAGRLLTNLLLIRMGYPPAIIRKAERTRYLTALRRADAGDHAPLAELLARAVLDTLMRFIVPAVAGPARLVPLAALATRDLSVRALRAAAERGRLRAQRDERGQWRSTRNWVTRYRKSRYKRET